MEKGINDNKPKNNKMIIEDLDLNNIIFEQYSKNSLLLFKNNSNLLDSFLSSKRSSIDNSDTKLFALKDIEALSLIFKTNNIEVNSKILNRVNESYQQFIEENEILIEKETKYQLPLYFIHSLINNKKNDNNLISDNCINYCNDINIMLLVCSSLLEKNSIESSKNKEINILQLCNDYFSSMLIHSIKINSDDSDLESEEEGNKKIYKPNFCISLKKLFKRVFLLLNSFEIYLFNFIFIDSFKEFNRRLLIFNKEKYMRELEIKKENNRNSDPLNKNNNIEDKEDKEDVMSSIENVFNNFSKMSLSFIKILPQVKENFPFKDIRNRVERIISIINPDFSFDKFKVKMIENIVETIYEICIEYEKKTSTGNAELLEDKLKNLKSTFFEMHQPFNNYNHKKPMKQATNNKLIELINQLLDKTDSELDNSGYIQDSEEDGCDSDDEDCCFRDDDFMDKSKKDVMKVAKKSSIILNGRDNSKINLRTIGRYDLYFKEDNIECFFEIIKKIASSWNLELVMKEKLFSIKKSIK